MMFYVQLQYFSFNLDSVIELERYEGCVIAQCLFAQSMHYLLQIDNIFFLIKVKYCSVMIIKLPVFAIAEY